MARASLSPLKLWLETLNLPQYHDNFIKHGINTKSDCQMLNDDILKQIGITLPGHRKRMLSHLPQTSEDMYVNSETDLFPPVDDGQMQETAPCMPVLPRKTKSQKNSFLYEDHKPLKLNSNDPEYCNVGNNMLASPDTETQSPRPVPLPRKSKGQLKSSDSNTSLESETKLNERPSPKPAERPKPAPRRSVGIKSPSVHLEGVCETESSTDTVDHSALYAQVDKERVPSPEFINKKPPDRNPSESGIGVTGGASGGATGGVEVEQYENVVYDPETESYVIRDNSSDDPGSSPLHSGTDEAQSLPVACGGSIRVAASKQIPVKVTEEHEEGLEQDQVYEPIWVQQNSKTPLKTDIAMRSSSLMHFPPSPQKQNPTNVLETMKAGERASGLFDLPPPGFPPPPLPASVPNPDIIQDFDPLSNSTPVIPARPSAKPFKAYENVKFPLNSISKTMPPIDNPEPDVNESSLLMDSSVTVNSTSLPTGTSNDPFQHVDPFESFEPEYQDFNKDKEGSPFSSPKTDIQSFKFPASKPPTAKQSPLAATLPPKPAQEENIYEFVQEDDATFDPFGLGPQYSGATKVSVGSGSRAWSESSTGSSVRLSQVPPAPMWYEAIDEDTNRMYSLATSLAKDKMSEPENTDTPAHNGCCQVEEAKRNTPPVENGRTNSACSPENNHGRPESGNSMLSENSDFTTDMYTHNSEEETSDSESETIPDIDSGATNGGGSPVPILPTPVLTGRKKERSGYLYKQGGVKQNRGWKKRWIIFDGENLRYYANQKCQVSKRVVPITCMRNVEQDCKEGRSYKRLSSDIFIPRRNSRRGSDITNSKQYKFKLHCSNRTFLFAAETLDDCNLWANTLMEAIISFKPPEGGIVPGGKMANPDIEGWIKLNRNKFKYYFTLKGRWMAYYSSKEDFDLSSPLNEIDMMLSGVKVLDCTRLQLSTNYDQFLNENKSKCRAALIVEDDEISVLDFESSQDTMNWKMAIEDAITSALCNDEVWNKVKDNPANTYCADCRADEAHWSSVNLGIVLCLKCAGIHRGFERKVSCVASLRMETKIWTPTLIEMLKAIGNDVANKFWVKHLPPGEAINFDTEPEQRKAFIIKKYKDKAFCDKHPFAADRKTLNEALLEAARTPSVQQTMQILFSGADILYSRADGLVAHDYARQAKQNIQMEFLYRNGGDKTKSLTKDDDIMARRLRDEITKEGFLHKTGPSQRVQDFLKRWCVVEHGQLSYYASNTSKQMKDHIDNMGMFCIQRSNRGDRYPYCFEISAKKSNSSRMYLFAADSEEDREGWIRTITQIFCPVSLIDKVKERKIDLAGYCYIKMGLAMKWQKTWILLEAKSLYMYDKENEEFEDESVDLRKVTSIRKITQGDDGCSVCLEQGVRFVISAPDRSIYFQADLVKDTERYFSILEPAIKIGGSTLEDQCLTADDVPVIVDKCINFIEDNGMEVKGVYREAAQESRIQDLLGQLTKDARSVVLQDKYMLNEVCNALKRFLRQLADPLLTTNLYTGWIRFSALRDHNNKLCGYKHNIQQLPRVNKLTLRRLAIHLSKLSKHSDQNKMTLDNIAIAFGSTLMNISDQPTTAGAAHVQMEMRVISEIVMYHEWLFDIEKSQQAVDDKIAAAMKMIKDLQDEGPRKSIAPMESIRIEVYYLDPRGSCQMLEVTTNTVALTLIQELQKKLSLSSEGWCLYEVIGYDNDLERPLHPDTPIWPLILEWSNWSEHYRANAKLCLKTNELIERIEQSYDPSQCLFSQMSYADKRKYSKFTFEFTQAKLSYYRDYKRMGEPIGSWNIEDLFIYKGCDQKRPANSPTNFSFTFVAKTDKVGEKDLPYFGRTVCCNSSSELFMWLAAMIKAQHPSGFQ